MLLKQKYKQVLMINNSLFWTVTRLVLIIYVENLQALWANEHKDRS